MELRLDHILELHVWILLKLPQLVYQMQLALINVLKLLRLHLLDLLLDILLPDNVLQSLAFCQVFLAEGIGEVMRSLIAWYLNLDWHYHLK